MEKITLYSGTHEDTHIKNHNHRQKNQKEKTSLTVMQGNKSVMECIYLIFMHTLLMHLLCECFLVFAVFCACSTKTGLLVKDPSLLLNVIFLLK